MSQANTDREAELERLDYPRFRTLLGDLATSFAGKQTIGTLCPFASREDAEETLGLVEGLKKRHESGEGLPSLELEDLRPTFARLGIAGSRLDAESLIGLLPLLRISRLVKQTLERSGTEPAVAALGSRLQAFPHLERALDETFEETGEIKDKASPELRRIRREREQRRERLRGRMEKLAGKLTRDEQATLVTLREDRYVLAVPSDQRRHLEGLVQDRSASGNTFYIEPLEVVQDNNALRELEAEERTEIRRILSVLTETFRGVREDLAANWEHLGYLDGLRARVLLAMRWRAEKPEFTEHPVLRLHQARHPLLLEARGAKKDPEEACRQVVPLDLNLDAETRLLLITGPNMGGKTVALKTLGILSALAQSGCLIPTLPGSRLPWVDHWLVSLGDEQSLDQDLSTFAAHLRRWAEALEMAGPEALVLLDELGSGTDPTEGAALAQSVLERLVESRALGLVTTHLGSLKGFAASAEGIQNASMVFDPGTRKATFGLAVGVPGESHALDMARSLGFPEERVRRAEALLPQEERDLKRLLEDLDRERRRVAETAEDLDRKRAEAEALVGEHRARLERLLNERATLRARAARQARELLRRAEETLKQVEKQARNKQSVAGVDRQRLVRDQTRLARLENRPPPQVGGDPPDRIVPGERYWAPVLQRVVQVVRAGEGSGNVLVENKGMRVTLPVTGLRTLSEEEPVTEIPVTRPVTSRPEVGEVPLEVNLRGMRVDECLECLDRALDRAVLAGLREFRVLHGKGTGTLRQAVLEFCRNHTAVKGTRVAEQWQGGLGVTVVELEG